MNAPANACGLGFVFAAVGGLVFLSARAAPPVVLGLAVGVICAGLYIVGMLVGRADARKEHQATLHRVVHAWIDHKNPNEMPDHGPYRTRTNAARNKP